MNAHEIPVLTLLKGGGINRNKKGNTKEGFNWSKAAVLVSAGILTSVVAGYLATQHPYTRGQIERGIINLDDAANRAEMRAEKEMFNNDDFDEEDLKNYTRTADLLRGVSNLGYDTLHKSDRFTDTMKGYMRKK